MAMMLVNRGVLGQPENEKPHETYAHAVMVARAVSRRGQPPDCFTM